jgi:hypothetical protein
LWYAPVADTSGGLTHELVIEGPRATVERSFADAEFTLAIDPKADKKAWDSELRTVRDHEEANQRELAALENTAAFFEKKTPPPLTAAKSVFVSLRKREPGGTKYLFKVTGFPVPVGFSFLFGLPPVCSTFGVLTPATGDQDLFLYRAWPPFGGLVASADSGARLPMWSRSPSSAKHSHNSSRSTKSLGGQRASARRSLGEELTSSAKGAGMPGPYVRSPPEENSFCARASLRLSGTLSSHRSSVGRREQAVADSPTT